MQTVGSFDQALPPQSDTGGRGRVTGGQGLGIQMDRVMSQWVGGVTGGWGRIPYIYHCKIHQSWWVMVEL